MKTTKPATKLKPFSSPPLPAQSPPSVTLDEIGLRAYFTAAALSGLCTPDGGGFIWEYEYMAALAVRFGDLTYEEFAAEHLSPVRRFNRKVGLE